MSNLYKVKLPPDNIGICRSCRNSNVVSGANNQLYVTCSEVSFSDMHGRDAVPFRVETCSRYDDKSTTSLGDMRRTAWIMESDETRKEIGFVSNKKWREKNPHKDIVYGED